MDDVELDLRDQGITDLSQVFIAEGITIVRLDRNGFSDLSPLKLPSTLKFLSMTANNIQSLDGLVLPEGLEVISFTGNALTDLSGFTWPNSLKELNLGLNQLDSFDKLGNLPNGLIDLDLPENQISSGTFNSPSKLKVLDLNGNPIERLTDISLVNVNQLELLQIAATQITDISDIGNFSIPDSLRLLILGSNEITDLSPIVNATNLRGVSFGADSITSLEGVSLPSNLEFLSIIGAFDRVDNFTLNNKLRILNLRSSTFNELGPNFVLNNNLRRLSLIGDFSDFSNLNLNKGLRVLSLPAHTKIDNVSKLPRLPRSLRRLNLAQTGLDNLEGLTLPRNVRALGLDDLSIADIPRSLVPFGSKLRKVSAEDTDISGSRQQQIRKRIRRRAPRAQVKFDGSFFDLFSNDFNLKFDFI